jgi:hypothetical protein
MPLCLFPSAVADKRWKDASLVTPARASSVPGGSTTGHLSTLSSRCVG